MLNSHCNNNNEKKKTSKKKKKDVVTWTRSHMLKFRRLSRIHHYATESDAFF